MIERSLKRLKRVYQIRKRNHDNHLVPLRITQKDLLDSKDKYEKMLVEICRELKNFHVDNTPLEVSPKVFSGYSILSINGDRMGKVLEYKGEIYRGIYSKSILAFKRLWNTGLLQVLSAKGMIPQTTLTDFSTKDYPIIIHHESVSISPSCSWSYDMIRDAAILICLIKRAAETVGFTLHDGHLNNVTYNGGRPVFTDIGSFEENRGQKTSCDGEILFTACYRLVAYHLGNSILNRLQLYDESNNTIWIRPIEYDDLTREYVCLLKQFRRYHALHSSMTCRYIIRKLFLEREVLPEYIELLFPALSEKKGSIDKNLVTDIETIESMVNDLPVRTCVDIGGNIGLIAAELSKAFGWKMHALEYDEDAARETYMSLKDTEYPVDTFMFNYCFGASEKKWQPFISDLAIAYDITNNCNIRQYYRNDSLLNSLSKLSRRYVLAVYFPERKNQPRYEAPEGSVKEKTDDFIRTFSEFFHIIKQEESGELVDSEEYRILILGEKKCAI